MITAIKNRITQIKKLCREKMNARIMFFFMIAVFVGICFINLLLATPEFRGVEEAVITRPNLDYRAEGLRDPFVSFLKEEEVEVPLTREEVPLSLPPLEIQGIVWGGAIPQAIINHKVVKVGDTLKVEGAVEEIKILKIEKEGIVVLYGNREHNLLSPAQMSLPKKEGGQDEESF